MEPWGDDAIRDALQFGPSCPQMIFESDSSLEPHDEDCLHLNIYSPYTVSIGVRARGLGAAAPQTRAKPLFFGQKLNFSGRSQQPKMKKNIFWYLLNEKTEFSLSSEVKCPKSGIFTNYYRVG